MDKLRGLKSARWIDAPPFKLEKARTTAQAKGITYERKVQRTIQHLVAGLATDIRIGPWIEYVSDRTRYAQPDVVVEFPDRVLVVEIKLTHRTDIDTKLHRFYKRLVKKLFPGKRVICAQVFRNASAATPLCPGLEALLRDWPSADTLLVQHR